MSGSGFIRVATLIAAVIAGFAAGFLKHRDKPMPEEGVTALLVMALFAVPLGTLFWKGLVRLGPEHVAPVPFGAMGGLVVTSLAYFSGTWLGLWTANLLLAQIFTMSGAVAGAWLGFVCADRLLRQGTA